MAFDAQAEPQWVRLWLTMKDGARLERTISLVGEAVRFETKLTAEGPRPFEFVVHPEYDTASMTSDPKVLSIYVKRPDWIQANGRETAALSEDLQRSMVRDAADGGAYAYFNHRAKFGVEHRFAPDQFSGLGLFWDPSRQQINLEMKSKIISLKKGQTAGYAYEVRYLKNAPKVRK